MLAKIEYYDRDEKIIFNVDEFIKECEEQTKNIKKVKSFSLEIDQTIMNKKIFKNLAIEEVELSDNLKKIPRGCFKNYLFKKIVLSNSIQKIGNKAFYGCNSLETVELSEKINGKLRVGTFLGCNSLKELIIHYNSSKQLMNNIQKMKINYIIRHINHLVAGIFLFISSVINELFYWLEDTYLIGGIFMIPEGISYLFCNFLEDLFHEGKKFPTSFITNFKGPQLTIEQEKKVKKFVKKISVGAFFENSINFLIEQYGEENTNLLTELDQTIEEIPTKSRKFALNLKQKLLDNYQQNKEKEKPKLDLKNEEKIILSIEEKEIGDAKEILTSQLTQLNLALSSQKEIIDFMKHIENDKTILDKEIKTQKESPQTIEDYLENLVFFSNQFLKEDQQKIIIKIKDMLETSKKELEKNLKEKILEEKSEINLIFTDELDPKLKLKMNLSNMHEEVEKQYQTVKPFLSLLSVLQNKEVKEYLEEDSIESMIQNIIYVLSEITNSNSKKEVINSFEKVKNKYIEKIEQIIQNKEVSKDSYKELCIELRNDLHPVLERLDNKANIEKNHKNFLQDLSLSFKLLNEEKIEEDQKMGMIPSFVQDILCKLNANQLTESEKENVIKEMKEILQQANQKVEKNFEKKSEQVEKELQESLIDILFKLSTYIKQKEEYQKEYSQDTTSISVKK